MSKKFLRPPSMYDEDDEEDDDDSDDSEASAAKKPPVQAGLSDDDDSEEDEESEEEAPSRPKRKKGPSAAVQNKKKARPTLFDMEAGDDDYDEDDEEGGDGEHMDEAMLAVIRQQDRDRSRRGNTFGGDDEDIHETALAIEQRNQMRARIQHSQQRPRQRARPVAPSASSGSVASSSAHANNHAMMDTLAPPVAQHSLVPSVKDPSFWMISCIPNKEAELVYQLMNKCIAGARQGRPFAITGIIAAQSKGKLYLESFREPAVLELITGVRGIMPSTKKKVPISDMTTVMTVQPSKKPVKVGEWVRMTRGHYKGDLGRVRVVLESGLKCIVQCVPRLDLALLDMGADEARVRRKTVKPPQKFFSAQEIASLGRHTTRNRIPQLDNVNCDSFEGNMYHDGYLLKEMTVGGMVKPLTPDDQPTLDELTRFQHRPSGQNDGYENESSKAAASLIEQISALQATSAPSARDAGLTVGDMIRVAEGDLIGLKGKVMSVTDGTVKMQPENTELRDPVEFLASQVRKYVEAGCTRIKPPQLQTVGSRKTLWVNYQEICKTLNRDPQHVYSFLMAELGTEGSIDGNQRLVIRGRYLPKYIESLLKKYAMEYVTCEMCRSPQTDLVKDQHSRLYFLNCRDCWSKRSVIEPEQRRTRVAVEQYDDPMEDDMDNFIEDDIGDQEKIRRFHLYSCGAEKEKKRSGPIHRSLPANGTEKKQKSSDSDDCMFDDDDDSCDFEDDGDDSTMAAICEQDRERRQEPMPVMSLSDRVMRLCMLQNANGSFTLALEDIQQIAGLTRLQVEAIANEFPVGKQVEEEAVKGTTLALVLFRVAFAKERSLWELQEQKALAWLKSSTTTAEDLLAKVQARCNRVAAETSK